MIAAIAFGASILVATSSICRAAADRPQVFERSIHGDYGKLALTRGERPAHVSALATAGGRGGDLVRRFRARRRALAKWRIKAARYYGPGATRWLLATDKSVQCIAHDDAVSCLVSARPANLLQRLGLMAR